MPLDRVSRRETLVRLQSQLEDDHASLLHVLTLNPEYVMSARADHAFLGAVADADLIVCDGAGTLIAARLLGSDQIERFTGVELIDHLAALSGFRESGGIFLLGGKDAAAAADRLRLRFPAARIPGAWSGGTPDTALDEESLQRIESAGADIVLVGYGAPAQDYWIRRNRDALEETGVRIAAGVGGALDYLSGHARAAPPIVRNAGMEWAWRLGHEPWRWKRQLNLVPFAGLVALEAVRARWPYRILGPDEPRDRRQDSGV